MLDVFDRVEAIKPTPRVERLRERYLRFKPRIEIDITRIVTRVMKETEGESWVTRGAKAFAAVVREMPINIAPDDLFVGSFGTTQEGEQVSAEVGPELEDVLHFEGEREFLLSDEVERELREEIIPYWRGQGDWARARCYWRPESERIIFDEVLAGRRFTKNVHSGHHGHTCLNFEKVLKKGFLGVKEDAEERLARLDSADPDELRKLPFLRSVVMAMEAAAEIGKRFAVKAKELAEKEEDAERKAELLKIAEVCDWVPAKPARTFYEALQSCWFTYILQTWEVIETVGGAMGRMDQYLYPYYESDIREGRITKEEAQELIDCWIMKLQSVSWSLRDRHNDLFGERSSAHLSVGGYKADGSDATNEVSYMFIEAMMHTRLHNPYFSVLIHSQSPDDFLIKACQLCSLGTGHPYFENSDIIVPGLLTRMTGGPPITIEDARSATSVGCQEVVISGKEGLTLGGVTNAAAALELALNNGISRLSPQQKSGLETGDPRQFKSFEEVREAYKKQLAWLLRKRVIISNKRELILAEMRPTVFLSALMDDCIEKGVCKEEGGARYNAGPGGWAYGLPDVADSLAAIKKVVFEDKRITMAQLCDALDKNFEGYDELRQMLLKVPKYGNDDDYADEQMVWAVHEWAVEFRKQRNTRGGHGVPGILAYQSHVSGGKVLGALPSGRLAGEALSDGNSPCAGNDLNGPTAVLRSLSKVNNFEMNEVNVLNMTLDPEVFKDGDVRRWADFLRTLVDLKVTMVQFNVVSSDTLRAAQKEPDKYRSLVVKVAGYNAFFVTLTEGLQNHIIARTEHKL
jgi:formate C-acetyltransferase